MSTVGELLQGSMIADQIELEMEAISAGVNRYRRLANEAIERGEGSSLKPAERLMIYWLEPLTAAIKREQEDIAAGKSGPGRGTYGPVIWKLDADRLAVIVLHEMVSRCMLIPGGDSFRKQCYAVGNAVVAEINHDMMREQEGRVSVDQMDRRFKRLTPMRINYWAKRTLKDSLWERKVCTHVGAILVHLVLANTVIEDEPDNWVRPFEHRNIRDREGKTHGMMFMHERVHKIIEDGHLMRQTMRPRYLPMLVPPYPWSDEGEGGYIRVRTPLMSKPTAEQHDALEEADLSTVYECLNAANSTAWRYSKPMILLYREMWDNCVDIDGIPAPDNRPMPPRPEGMDDDPDLLKAWKAEAHEVHTENSKLKGQRVEFLQRLTNAERMIDTERLYNPEIFDFRYRKYPIPQTSFHHHGDHVCKGAMLFADSVPLTDRGRYWLRVNAANAYGYDKVDFDTRVSFIEDNMAHWEACVKDPLDNIDIWHAADEPALFLHSIMGLFDDSIGSRLPIGADGTANGIQHLETAGRNVRGAEAVNVIPGDAPRDPYSKVLHRVIERVEDDDGPIPDLVRARNSDDLYQYLVRGTVKQSCMTTVYGVTPVGARNQIADKLKKLGMERARLFKAAGYLSKVTLESVGDIFPASAAIMSWLRECGRIMTKADETRSIRWTSPLGAPVVQPYRNIRKFRIQTVVQEIHLGHRDTDAPISASKQCQGVIPNWVHTLDSGHACLTGLESKKEGIEFGSVHDQFLTHASHMDILHEIIRAQFVELHKVDRLGMLHQEWQAAYPDVEIPMPPARGSLDITEVLNSPYFFH